MLATQLPNIAIAQTFNKSHIKPGEARPADFAKGDARVNFRIDADELRDFLNKELSTLCVLSEFNQRHLNRRYVNIRLEDGRVRRFGFALGQNKKKDLIDYHRHAKSFEAYLFRLDSTSECRVYAVPAAGRLRR